MLLGHCSYMCNIQNTYMVYIYNRISKQKIEVCESEEAHFTRVSQCF